MDELKFEIGSEEVGLRIDKCIALRLGDGYSRTFVKFLMENGFVHVNDKVIKPRCIVREGDAVHVELPPPEPHDLEPEDIPLNIIYEDEWVIVLDKPAGLVVHPGAGNKTGTMVNALLFHCDKLPDTGDYTRPGIVHRLDKDTSGVMVAAKNDYALRSLSKQFEKRAIKKRYVALVKGVVEMDNGLIDAPIARHNSDRKKMDVEYIKGKNARTIYHVVKRFKEFTFLRIEIETGRTHQIRVHMKHLGYPVLGDSRYGVGRGMMRQALHAEMLGFTHPETGKYMEFTSPIPDDIQKVIDKGSL